MISDCGADGTDSKQTPALRTRLAKAVGKKNFTSAARPDRNLTREDLVDAVISACMSLSRAEARDMLEITLDEIVAALLSDDKVKLRGFGAFHILSRRERIGRNPRTGVEVKIGPRRVLTFTPGETLRARVNGERADGSAG